MKTACATAPVGVAPAMKGMSEGTVYPSRAAVSFRGKSEFESFTLRFKRGMSRAGMRSTANFMVDKQSAQSTMRARRNTRMLYSGVGSGMNLAKDGYPAHHLKSSFQSEERVSGEDGVYI